MVEKFSCQVGTVARCSTACQRCAVVAGSVGNNEPEPIVQERLFHHYGGIIASTGSMEIENRQTVAYVGIFYRPLGSQNEL
jgi:hypothetical protein